MQTQTQINSQDITNSTVILAYISQVRGYSNLAVEKFNFNTKNGGLFFNNFAHMYLTLSDFFQTLSSEDDGMNSGNMNNVGVKAKSLATVMLPATWKMVCLSIHQPQFFGGSQGVEKYLKLMNTFTAASGSILEEASPENIHNQKIDYCNLRLAEISRKLDSVKKEAESALAEKEKCHKSGDKLGEQFLESRVENLQLQLAELSSQNEVHGAELKKLAEEGKVIHFKQYEHYLALYREYAFKAQELEAAKAPVDEINAMLKMANNFYDKATTGANQTISGTG